MDEAAVSGRVNSRKEEQVRRLSFVHKDLGTTRGAMHDMASSTSRSRSTNGRLKRKFPARSTGSPVNSVGDSSRESSECSGVTTPALVKLSRGLPATEPVVSHVTHAPSPILTRLIAVTTEHGQKEANKQSHEKRGVCVYVASVRTVI